MANEFHQGDEVEWNTSQGKTRGKVIRKLTEETHVKGHKVAASKENPEYLVESEQSGERAAHKPESLRNRGGS